MPARRALLSAALAVAASSASAATLRVGPGRAMTLPSQAAAAAQDGDVIEIDAGTYSGDVATWRQSRLTIRGVGGLAHLEAAGQNAQGKGIWVIQGADTVIENIEFSGATVPDMNGAGIRQEGANLTLRGCSFHDNENGILTSANASSDILIERSAFFRNGAGDGQSHNIYVGAVRSLTVRASHLHDARVGHDLKSRAATNLIEGNRITSEDGGNPSYEIDLPNGGVAWILGNIIHQGANADNGTLVSFAAEGATNPTQALFVAYNTVIDERGAGTFVNNRSAVPAIIVDNLVVGAIALSSGPASASGNLTPANPLFVDRASFDLRLAPGSPAIGAAVPAGVGNGRSLAPTIEYVHPLSSRPRATAVDVGAFEVPPAAPDAGVRADAAAPDAQAPRPDASPGAPDARPAEDASPSPPDAEPAPSDAQGAAPDAATDEDAAAGAGEDAASSGLDAGAPDAASASADASASGTPPVDREVTGSCAELAQGAAGLLAALAALAAAAARRRTR